MLLDNKNMTIEEIVEMTNAPEFLIELDNLFYKVEQEDDGALKKVLKYAQNPPRIYKTAIYWIKKLADEGYSSAQHILGMAHRAGLCVKHDEKVALKWFLLSANQGYTRAQFYVGLSFKYGHGTKVQYEEAVNWLKIAAANNYAMAMTDLASSYLIGQGIEQDYKMCINLLQKAVSLNCSAAKLNLGILYTDARMYSQETIKKGVKYMIESAREGNTIAINDVVMQFEIASN